MQTTEFQGLFNDFLTKFDPVTHDQLWETQSLVFRGFWNDKILDSKHELTVAETDSIIRLLDTKARGHQKTDEAVAQTGVRQGIWGRLFDHLKNKRVIT